MQKKTLTREDYYRIALSEFESQKPNYPQGDITEIMKTTAGDELVSRMEEVLGSAQSAISWYYTPIKDFGNKSAYDYCLKNMHPEVKAVLCRIEDGIFY